MASLVLTVIGDDRAGLVSALSSPISSCGGSWERSQFARLAGKFAGILQVSVPDARVDELVGALSSLSSSGLQVLAERTDAAGVPVASVPMSRLALSLIGSDRPGIVAEISALLASHGVNIEDLATEVREAPMAGGLLFSATAVLAAPASANSETLRAALEALADELMVEVSLSES
jgi:glycine cleavage system regulatory protein